MNSSFEPAISWLKSILRELSRIRLQQYLRLQSLSVEGLNDTTVPIVTDRMAMILLSTPDFRIVFKAHFDPLKTSTWANLVYKDSTKSLNARQIADFIKEFCNLTGGAMKNELVLHQLECGLSLPLIASGFDDLFFPPPNGESHFSDRWRLHHQTGNLVCSSNFEILNSDAIKNLKLGPMRSLNESSGEVEIL